MRQKVSVGALFLIVSLLYVGPAFVPGHLFVPLDIPRDFEAWKPSVLTRVRVSNSLLSDVVVEFLPWDTEVVRLIRAGQFPWRNPLADQGAPLFANPHRPKMSVVYDITCKFPFSDGSYLA